MHRAVRHRPISAETLRKRLTIGGARSRALNAAVSEGIPWSAYSAG
jgi:hypothetical protein